MPVLIRLLTAFAVAVAVVVVVAAVGVRSHCSIIQTHTSVQRHLFNFICSTNWQSILCGVQFFEFSIYGTILAERWKDSLEA